MIALLNVTIDCTNGDKLVILNDDKKIILIDYCANLKIGPNSINYAMFLSKYLILRMETSTSKMLTVEFDLVFLDAAPPSTIQASPPLQLAETVTNQTQKENFSLKQGTHIFIIL